MISIRELTTSPPAEVLAVAAGEAGPSDGLASEDAVTASVSGRLCGYGKAAAVYDAAVVVGSQGDRVVRALRRVAPAIGQVLLLESDPSAMRTLLARASEAGGCGAPWDGTAVAYVPSAPGGYSVDAALELLGFLSQKDIAFERTFLYVHPSVGNARALHAPLEAAARDVFFGLGARFLSSITAMGERGRASMLAWADHHAETGAALHALKLYYALRDAETAPRIAQRVMRCWIQLGCFEPIAEWIPFLAPDPAAHQTISTELLASLSATHAEQDVHLAANLAVLAEHHPEVHRKVMAWPPATSLAEVSLADAIWVAQPATAAQLERRRLPVIIDLVPGSFRLATALPDVRRSHELLDTVYQKRHTTGLIFGSVRHLDTLLNALAFPPQIRTPNWEHAVYVVERDVAVFRQVLRCLNLTSFFRQERISWFVGDDAADDLRAFFAAHRDRPLCETRVDADESLGATLDALLGERRSSHERQVQAIGAAYSPGADRTSEIRRAFANRDRPLRICFYSSYFTFVVRHAVADLARAASRLGMEVLEFLEQKGTDRLIPAVCIEKLLAFRPDMVVLVDRLRPEVEYLPATLPTVAWIQDELPSFAEPSTIRQLGPLDVTYTVSTPLVEGYRAMGYPWVGLLHMGVDTDLYKPNPGLPPPTDEIAFITNLAPLNEPPAYPGLYGWLLEAMKERGIGRTSKAYFEPLLREAAEVLGLTISEEGFRQLLYNVRIELELHFDRSNSARTLIRAGMPVALYGNGWDAWPEFRPYARGRVTQGEELCRVYQRHKVVLHVNALLNMHQRVLEGIASGAFVLARSSPTDRLPGEVASCLDIGSEIAIYSTPEELVAMARRAFADEPWRRSIIEAGRGRVIAEHTYAQRVERMVADTAEAVLRS